MNDRCPRCGSGEFRTVEVLAWVKRTFARQETPICVLCGLIDPFGSKTQAAPDDNPEPIRATAYMRPGGTKRQQVEARKALRKTGRVPDDVHRMLFGDQPQREAVKTRKGTVKKRKSKVARGQAPLIEEGWHDN